MQFTLNLKLSGAETFMRSASPNCVVPAGHSMSPLIHRKVVPDVMLKGEFSVFMGRVPNDLANASYDRLPIVVGQSDLTMTFKIRFEFVSISFIVFVRVLIHAHRTSSDCLSL